MRELLLVSVVPLLGAFGLGAVDGLYFHLRRYRLFAHRESRGEHALHTVRSVLTVPTLALLFLVEATGVYLWAAAACIAMDQVALALDLRAEAASRRLFGGLSAAEYQIHVAANGLHGVAVALALASRPQAAWGLTASSISVSSLPFGVQVVIGGLWLASAVAAIQHVTLLFADADEPLSPHTSASSSAASILMTSPD